MNEQDKLIIDLYSALDNLDTAYCTMGNNQDFSLGLSEKEYKKVENVLIEAEKYLFDEKD